MKQKIQEILKHSLMTLVSEGTLSSDQLTTDIPVEYSRRQGQGDFATAVAMILARSMGRNPREVAELIRQRLPSDDLIERTEVAGPGFINIYLSAPELAKVVPEILKKGKNYGCVLKKSESTTLLEFVSANPTGPLHVGHGRGAAIGDSLARLLRATGESVDTEYYVNDMGRQMDILTVSVWIRYLQLCGDEVNLPNGAYQGRYVLDCAEQLHDQFDVQLRRAYCSEFKNIADDERILDQAIAHARELLGKQQFNKVRQQILTEMVQIIRKDLNDFDVKFDYWFHESWLINDDSSEYSLEYSLERTIKVLRSRDFLYEQDGATWFRSSKFGDEKDRVLVRSNGEFTYFASDIAYHLNKYVRINKTYRRYDRFINIWGADHHGYIPRMKAAMDAAGKNPEQLQIVIAQFASLFRAGQRVKMSTRAGEFVTLRELFEETGKDAARFFYVLRKSEQHLDFDLELAKSKNSENPVYYVQYAHARICSVFRQMVNRKIVRTNERHYPMLTNELEQNLIKRLSRYPDVIQSAAAKWEPHQIAYYLRDLANDFHAFYSKMRILDAEPRLREVRLDLIQAVGQVLKNGLYILGVSAPESM